MKSLKGPFGKLLKEYRAKAGLSQLELAIDSELNRTYISMLELGKREPTLRTMFRICAALEISPSAMVRELEKRMS